MGKSWKDDRSFREEWRLVGKGWGDDRNFGEDNYWMSKKGEEIK